MPISIVKEGDTLASHNSGRALVAFSNLRSGNGQHSGPRTAGEVLEPDVHLPDCAQKCSRKHVAQAGGYTALTLHREKLISLGTLAAGLMHELNNPGAAAKRAASQLRENMTRQQKLSLSMTRAQLTPDQLECLAELQEEVFGPPKAQTMGSLEQSDAEEALTEWLEGIGVENAWKMGPTLVAAGWKRGDIECAKESFPGNVLSDALNYLEALISNMQLVGTIEESIARVTELVMAVKKYAYEDKNKQHKLDIHDTIQSTLRSSVTNSAETGRSKSSSFLIFVLTTCGSSARSGRTCSTSHRRISGAGKITVRT